MTGLAIRENHAVAELVNSVIVELAKGEQAEAPVRHFFAPGIAVREVEMRAGGYAVGHIQKFPHLNVFLKGKVRMLNGDGSFTDLVAPMIYVGEPGRKVGYIMEDIVWQNIYATDLTDPEEVENYFLDKSSPLGDFEEYRLEAQPCCADHDDYASAISELGYTQDMVDAECLRDDDIIPFPFGAVSVQVSASKIHGKGLFATARIDAGTMIPARINGKRTPAGRYTNHSKSPNARFVDVNGDVYLQAMTDINGCRGGLLGEEITIDYRNAFRVARGIK